MNKRRLSIIIICVNPDNLCYLRTLSKKGDLKGTPLPFSFNVKPLQFIG